MTREQRYPRPSGEPADYVWGSEEHHREAEEHWAANGRVPNAEAVRVFEVLDEFARAWYEGRLGEYQPDPLWVWPWLGRDLTDTEVEALVETLYEEHQLEAKTGYFRAQGYETAVPWTTFPPDAKRCLAQRVVAVLNMEAVEDIPLVGTAEQTQDAYDAYYGV